jgi:hypothetical protein
MDRPMFKRHNWRVAERQSAELTVPRLVPTRAPPPGVEHSTFMKWHNEMKRDGFLSVELKF